MDASPSPPSYPPPLERRLPITHTNFVRCCIRVATQILGAPCERKLERRKLALLIGVGYSGMWELKGSQCDVESLRTLLEERNQRGNGSFSSRVVVLSDAKGTPENLTPTHDNIMEQLKDFMKDDGIPTDYLFVYSGHSSQRQEVVAPGKRPVEEDGLEEYIIPCDAVIPNGDQVDEKKVINDKKLNDLLVKRLPKGSHLVALFDSCHSGTLLNLRHHRCNRTGDYISLIQDAGRHVFIEPIYSLVLRRCAHMTKDTAWYSPWLLRKAGTEMSMISQISTDSSAVVTPWRIKKCTGFCPRRPSSEEPQVVSISSCKDSQSMIESNDGGLVIQAVVDLMSKSREPTYREVMLAAKAKTEAIHKGVVNYRNTCKKANKCHWPFPWHWHTKCLTEEDKVHWQMVKMKAEPQLSSRQSFSTKRTLFRI